MRRRCKTKNLERTGVEPVTSSMPLKRATNCANARRKGLYRKPLWMAPNGKARLNGEFYC